MNDPVDGTLNIPLGLAFPNPSGFVFEKVKLSSFSTKFILSSKKFENLIFTVSIEKNKNPFRFFDPDEDKGRISVTVMPIGTTQTVFCEEFPETMSIVKILGNRNFLQYLHIANESITNEVLENIKYKNDFELLKRAWKHYSKLLEKMNPEWITNFVCRAKKTLFEEAINGFCSEFDQRIYENVRMSLMEVGEDYVLIEFGKPIYLARFGSYEKIKSVSPREIMKNLSTTATLKK